MGDAVSVRCLEPTETFFCLTVLQSTPSRARGLMLNHPVEAFLWGAGQCHLVLLFLEAEHERGPALDAQPHCLETPGHLPGRSWERDVWTPGPVLRGSPRP